VQDCGPTCSGGGSVGAGSTAGNPPRLKIKRPGSSSGPLFTEKSQRHSSL
jgi:hypothetical protein